MVKYRIVEKNGAYKVQRKPGWLSGWRDCLMRGVGAFMPSEKEASDFLEAVKRQDALRSPDGWRTVRQA